MNFIECLFDIQSPTTRSFKDYDFQMYDDLSEMVRDIKERDKETGLSRMVAGYAWPWVSRENPEYNDIEI